MVIASLCAAQAVAAGEIALAPVEYRLVGDGGESPEKARMIEEKVAAGLEDAGLEVLRGEEVARALEEERREGGARSDPALLDEVAVRTAADRAVLVSVAESGALYEFTVAVSTGVVMEGQVTGPFSEAMAEARRLAREAVEAPPEEASPNEPAPEEGPPPPAETDGDGAAEQGGAEAAPADGWLYDGSIALTAIGGAALAVGIVLLVVDDPCVEEDSHGCRERLDASSLGIPFAGVGALAAGLGIAGLVLLEDDGETDQTARVSVGAAPSHGGAAATCRVSF